MAVRRTGADTLGMIAEGALAGPNPIRVLLVDDNAQFRESLVSLLESDEITVVGQASSGEEVLALAAETHPDVVLMDVRMPEMDGIQATGHLKQRFPDIGVVALTGHEDQRIVREMLVAGASGYVLKDSDGDEIIQAVQQAASGHGVLSPEVTPTVIDQLTESLERERRRARQLEIAQEALLERAARRRELISRLSHELRTPVTVILATAQLLARGTLPPEERGNAAGVLAERAQALVRLLERFEVAVESGITEWADVNALAREVAASNPRLTVETTSGPAMATLNRSAGIRILEELVENALAYSPEDTPVTISVSRRSAAPEVRVIDRGSGVELAASDRIFSPLEQAESLHTRTHQGAGFGLALARMSARAMDGDVVLETTGPEGSTFLWIVAGDERATAPMPRVEPAEEGPEPQTRF